MKRLRVIANITLNATPSRKMLDGIEHLVIPCVAIREGILNGIFYSSSELEAFANTWNGVPVPVRHPKDGDNYVTANSTTCWETVNIGQFFNVIFEDKAIKGEIWLNIGKAEKLGFSYIIESLEAGEMMEVSTGLFGNTYEQLGTYGGKAYEFAITNIHSDHLALLPDEVGACSIEDGCGAMRTNKELIPNCSCQGESPKPAVKPNAFQRLLGVLGFGANQEQSHNEIREACNRALRETLGKDEWAWIANVFDKYFIFELNGLLYRYNYTIDADGNAILVGERVEVKLETSYVPVSVNTDNNRNPTRKSAIVNALALAFAANASAGVTDADKAPFNGMSDAMLNNMADKQGLKFDDNGNPIVTNATSTTPAVVPPPLPTATAVANAAAPVAAATPTEGLSSDEKQVLANLLAEQATRLQGKRNQLIQANKGYTEDNLKGITESTLDVMISNLGIASNVVPIFGMGGAVPVTGNSEKQEPRQRPSVMFGNGLQPPAKQG